ncbi:hypothetical protein CTAYLR_007521 [Chrysophaeum taylorii]|uniref:Palmitoyltransferase n=1 Tax=Chrysophaeum taylorii TaxID=2483200 RepID=A0AAD7U7D2_9STRA|nr:hypothetical protein CTAYLR_007521 [Chrysophaeum taylorii]
MSCCLMSNRNYYWLRLCQQWCVVSFEWCMFGLGPVLIVTVVILAVCETYWALKFLVPESYWRLHATWIAWLFANALFNYFACVLTDPGTHSSVAYKNLVVEASDRGEVHALDVAEYFARHGFSAAAAAAKARPAEDRRRRRVHQSWMDRGPFEWGYCKYTHSPKAPRSHYDHVTKKLVLNMDHYCPWMFNVVGYGNYRFFLLFLWWVTVSAVYGVALTAMPFASLAFPAPKRRAWRPRSKQARSAVMFTFVLAISVGIAVAVLGAWHLFLVLTAQTTIEFYGNHALRGRAAQRGMIYRNPYDQGCRKNWEHVFGAGHPLFAILPSARPPPAKPWPSSPHDQRMVIPHVV